MTKRELRMTILEQQVPSKVAHNKEEEVTVLIRSSNFSREVHLASILTLEVMMGLWINTE